MRLFPEVRPDRGFDWGEESPDCGPHDGNPAPEITTGDAPQAEGIPELLTDSRSVRSTDGKAPRQGLEPLTQRLTLRRLQASRSAGEGRGGTLLL